MPIKFDTTTRTPLTEGGEGYIYEYNGKIIKTFKPHIDIAAKERKVNALMKTTLPKAVITPIDTVLDMRGRFIGYCMEKVSGKEVKRLSNRKFVTANNITTKDILGLLVKVKSALEEVHKQNIYVGDLNDQNILFDTAENIYLIDCDSWAVGNDKCTVAMDMFKDPRLNADNFNADTDNYAFMVLAWKSLTRVHPFGGTIEPDMPILDRIAKGISVIDRQNVKLPRLTKEWKGFSPDLVSEFKAVFEGGVRTLSGNMEDMLANLTQCKKDKEYYYSKFSSCPYCNSSAQVNKKPVSQGSIGGLKLYAIYDGTKIKAVFDRYTYLDNEGYVVSGNNKNKYYKRNRYYFTACGAVVFEDENAFNIEYGRIGNHILKKYKSMVEAFGDKVYFISPQNTFKELVIVDENNNGIKSICKVSNTAYFAVSGENYCVVNYYTGKIIVNINGTNTVIDYNSDIVNYGIHHDEVSGKWLIILEDSKGKFNTFVISGATVEYHTDAIKYACQLNCPCIYNSNIFIPVDGKIRGYSYKKSAFKDFECNVVSEESKLIKEKNRFVIVNLENVYYLEN
ncbi:MAG: hypothetical protein HFH72_09185 [Lachnospiraceae bacterium]|nr:hypothetical protein [Lachnospiraceae bacterium]